MGFFQGNIPTSLTIQGRKVLVYVDEGWGRDRIELIESTVATAVQNAEWGSGQELYLIAYVWAEDNSSMVDLWRFTENPVDNISGPLADVRVMQDGKHTKEFGAASGNTLLVLGLEEAYRRNCKTLTEYLSKRPDLPKELIVKIR